MVYSNAKYVAKTGNDTTGDGSSGNPWLTFAKGLTEALSDGTIDALLIGDGTYKDGDYSIGSLTDLYIAPQTISDGTNVIIQNSNAGDDRVFATNTGTDNVRFGRLTLDAEGKDHIIRTGGTSGTTISVTYDGTRLINFKECAHRSGGSTYFRGQYYIYSDQLDGVASPAAVQIDPDQPNRTLLLGGSGTIDVTGGPASTITGVSVIPDSTIDNTNIIIEDGCTIKVTRDDRTVDDGLRAISIGTAGVSTGYGEIYIGEVDVDLEGSDEPFGIMINVDKTAAHLPIDKLTIRKPNIKNNSYATLGVAGGGYGINIGGEFDIASDVVGEVVVTRLDYQGGTIDGFDHAEYFGGLNGHDLGYGGLIKNSVLGAVIEGCTGCTLAGRSIIDPDPASGSAGLRVKDSTSCAVEQNTVIVTNTAFAGDAIEERDGATPTSTGNAITNNNVIFPASLSGTPKIVDSDSNTTLQATYSNNHYYKGGDAFASTDFNDEGVARDLSGWLSNVESTAVSESGHATNLTTGAIAATSDLVDAGSTSATAQRDFNGRFFGQARPIGAFTQHSSTITSSGSTGSNGIATKGLISR